MSAGIAGLNQETWEDPLDLMDEIEELKKKQDATILAHYYVDGEIQDVADFTGDSLKLARDATKVSTSTILFSGVHFMAETAKMLNPEKRVLLPDLLAGCSLAESCQPEALRTFQDELRAEGREFDTVAYINTSAAVKSLCDWIVTSGNAREIIERVPEDREILFVPDQHLGRYLAEVTGRKMMSAEHSGDQRFHRRNRGDAEACRQPDRTAYVSGRDGSQHAAPAGKVGSAAHLHSRARDHDVDGRNLRVQPLPAYGP